MPDEDIERTRAASEPPILQPSDITSLEVLMRYAGPANPDTGRAIKFTLDLGATWRLGVVHGPLHDFQGGHRGFSVAMELDRNGVSLYSAVTDGDFRNGLVIRLASPTDCAGITFSFDCIPAWW
ncbi:MAG TPA: hypothetical protein VGH44_01050 [Candidatus Saccharimonadia bacterium]|jgi:hypothetical protein